MAGAADLADEILAANMDAFAVPVAFAEPVVVVPGTADGGRGIFDRAHELVDMSSGVPVSTTGPVLGIRLAEFVTPPAQGDRMVIAGILFEAYDVKPDGQGGAKLVLKVKGA